MPRLRQPKRKNQIGDVNKRTNDRGRGGHLHGVRFPWHDEHQIAAPARANEVPIMRPPILAAKLSPVPRR